MAESTEFESVVSKLEELSERVSDQEREVLGELLQHAADGEVGFESGPLGAAIADARTNGKVRTRLTLEQAPEGMVLVAKGVSAGRLA